MASYKVGILGATGAVGEQMRIVLAERKFPISELRLFGSARSAGKVINYEGQTSSFRSQPRGLQGP